MPLAASLTVHAALFAGLWWAGARLLSDAPQRAGIEHEIGIVASSGSADAPPLTWDAAPPGATDPPPGATPTRELAFGALPDAITAARAGDRGGFARADAGAAGVLGTGAGVPERSGGQGFGEGFGQGVETEGAGVWGLRVAGARFAYVIDFSGSIIVTVEPLKREICRSVGRLGPGQAFDAHIFFSTGGIGQERLVTESFASRLVPAEPDAKRRFFAWIHARSPSGGTEPLAAMKRALAQAPQAIFFFSDGYFEDSVADEIARMNQDVGAQIHCLVFDELLLQDTGDAPRMTDGARRLDRIARESGGRLRVVTGADLEGR